MTIVHWSPESRDATGIQDGRQYPIWSKSN